MRSFLLALLATGCLAAPPPTADDGDGDDDRADAGEGPDAGADHVRCPDSAALDLAWVSEVVFDLTSADQITLHGLAVIINPGPKPIELGTLLVEQLSSDGGVLAGFTLTGTDLAVGPSQAKGALSTEAASTVLGKVPEEWTDVGTPSLDVVLHLDGSGEGAVLPLRLMVGDHAFDLELRVTHLKLPDGVGWATRADRASASCP